MIAEYDGALLQRICSITTIASIMRPILKKLRIIHPLYFDHGAACEIFDSDSASSVR